jgi:diphthamide synthase (EF-2-diphthine--ammonia ligase)
VTKRGWRVLGCITGVAAVAAVAILAQACGGGSASEDASPTATNPPAAASATPGARPTFTPGAGAPGRGLFVGGASEEFAEFLGISLEQLESELSAEGATPASVAEAHGRTREELKAFFTEQQETQLSDAVAAGTMSQEDADNQMQALASRIDDIIDGTMPSGGGPGAGGFAAGGTGQGLFIAGPSEEFAQFLGIPLDQLESELSAEGATPASVAEAHGRTRDELKSFLTEQQQAQLLEEVAAGTISVEQADSMTERLASTIDDIIDGKVPSGGPGFAPTPSAQQ